MQGFNMGRYMPPASLDNALSAKSEKGFNEDSRKKRGPGGAQTIRFEMPFAIWCTTCQPETIIAQGIRFNAEKKKVGNYFSTSIWAFRMKHSACGGTIEIRTDPEQREYIVTEGARRREIAALSNEGAFGEILTEAERERRRTDAFAQLEGKKQESKVARTENDRVEELIRDSQTNWQDPYTLNQRLRKSFRADRKLRTVNDKEKASIAERYGLGFNLLDNTSEDAIRASLVDFESATHMRDDTMQQSLFMNPVDSKSGPGSRSPGHDGLKSSAEMKSFRLQAGVLSNTRAASDPFLNRTASDASTRLQLKRKRVADISEWTQKSSSTQASVDTPLEHSVIALAKPVPLIVYDSDTD